MAKKILSDLLGNRDLTAHCEKTVNPINTSKRLPSIMLVDTSGSMRGYENLLKSSVESLYDKILADPVAGNVTELAVMTFNSDIEILERMREIKLQESQGHNLDFHCEGVTLTGLALKAAISQLEARKEAYSKNMPKVRYYSPIIFLVSDGHPYCSDPAVSAQEKAAMAFSKQYIRQEVAADRLIVISVEVGDECDHELMRELTGLYDDRHVTKVKDAAELANFFSVSSSIIISSSKTGTKGLNEISFKDMK